MDRLELAGPVSAGIQSWQVVTALNEAEAVAVYLCDCPRRRSRAEHLVERRGE